MSHDVILANYLKENPVWVELFAVLEEAWGSKFRDLATDLANVRDLYQVKARNYDLVKSFQDFKVPDRETVQRVCTMMGFTYPNVDDKLFSAEDYLRIAQNISAYYQEQGTDSFLAFFSYCLNYVFTLVPQWTQDYETFYDEGDPAIGLPVWQGGTWYPTSHVSFSLEVGRIPPDQFEPFFRHIAPIHLVLLATRFTDASTINTYHMVTGTMTVYLTNITE